MEPTAFTTPSPVSPPAPSAGLFPLRRITALCDLSPAGVNAARRAALLASEHGARLRLACVRSRRAQLAEAETALAGVAADLRQRLPVDIDLHCVQGHPVRAACDAAADSDLLVVRAAGAHPAAEWLLGTHPGRLLPHCAPSLLVVRKPASVGYRRVLASVAFDGGAARVIAAAAGVMRAPHQQVLDALAAEPAWRPSGPAATDRLLAARRLRAVVQDVMADKAGARAIANAPLVVLDPSAADLLQRARSALADVVVLARQPDETGARWPARSAAARVLAGTPSDLLLLPWAAG